MKRSQIFLWITVLCSMGALTGCGSELKPPPGATLEVPTATPAVPEVPAKATAAGTDMPAASPSPFPSDENRFVESAGAIGFSYTVPAGWDADEDFMSGLTNWYGPKQAAPVCLTISFQETDGNIRMVANCRDNTILIFLVISYEGTPREFFDETLVPSFSYLEASNLVSLEAFAAPGDDQSAVAVVTYENQGETTRMAVYGFHKDGLIVLGAYARLEEDGGDQDALVVTVMKSFRFES